MSSIYELESGFAQNALLVQPTPLVGELKPAEEPDLHAFGVLGKTIQALAVTIDIPVEMAMNNVLSALSLTLQDRAEVQSLYGYAPINLFLATIAGSGERKSASSKRTLKSIREYERQEKAAFEAAKAAAKSKPNWDEEVIEGECTVVDELPQPSMLNPARMFSDVTLEGFFRRMLENQKSVGIIADEGGVVLGGFSMKGSNSLASGARFSKLWDGGQIELIRSTSEPIEIDGVKVTVHLMIQDNAGREFLSNEAYRNQGLLARFLVVWPRSKVGTRMIASSALSQAERQHHEEQLHAFDQRISSLLEMGKYKQEIYLDLNEGAMDLLIDLHDRVEEELGITGRFDLVKDFACKAPEHAARIAANIQLFFDEDSSVVTQENMEIAIAFTEWYLFEQLRIAEAHQPTQLIANAEKLRSWLCRKFAGKYVSVRLMVQKGPAGLRDAETIKALVEVLVEHGWLHPVTGPQSVDGQVAKQVWRVTEAVL